MPTTTPPNQPNPTKTLYLIDGHAQIFRAYYAIRGGMTSPVTGEPTNAVFAFAGMLIKLLDQFHPHYVVMAADLPGPTFRHEIYPEYKATREAPPEDLAPQIERIFEMTHLFGIPLLTHEGAEADDIIATIAQRTLDDPDWADVHVKIVSKDKDLEQLLTDRVSMFDIHTDTTIDVATLKQTKGITPEQVVEVQTLTGDKIDNIPGIVGMGPKTAAKLIAEYGTVDALLANLDKIKGKRHDNIENGREFLGLARRLVTLKRDLDIDITLDAATVSDIDAPALRRFFAEMGFRRHRTDLDRLLGTKPPSPPSKQPKSEPDQPSLFATDPSELVDPRVPRSSEAQAVPSIPITPPDCHYHPITTQIDLDDLATTAAKQKILAVDTETIGLGHRAPLCGICIAWEPKHAFYIPMRSPDPDAHLDPDIVLDTLRPLLEDPGVPKCGHNIKYDLLVLRNAGVDMRGVTFDSMIAAHLLGEPARGMDDLALNLLNHHTIPITDLIGPRQRGKPDAQKTMDQVPLDQITPYAAEDADITLRLYQHMAPRLKDQGMADLAERVEMPLVHVLADMQHNGIRVDPTVLAEQKATLSDQAVALREQIQLLAGQEFNVDSPKQLADILFNQLKLPVIKKTKTGPSTDIEVLEKLCEREDLTEDQIAIPRLMVEYRQIAKLLSTYLDALADSIDPNTKRVHANFHQTGAATGRLSSSDPNLQNIPIRTELGRQIRRAFVAEPGHTLICADYSQIELRILAHLSGDPALIDAFNNDQDIHAAVAAQVFGVDPDLVDSEQRSRAKVINFGIVYGITPYGLSRRVEGLSVEDAKALIDDYNNKFPGIQIFLDQCVHEALDVGYVTTILGRRRAIPQLESSNANTRALGERLAINTAVQGSAADLIKLAMVNLDHHIKTDNLPLSLLLQIHDELVLEAPTTQAELLADTVRTQMQDALKLKVPIKVDLGTAPNWLAAK